MRARPGPAARADLDRDLLGRSAHPDATGIAALLSLWCLAGYAALFAGAWAATRQIAYVYLSATTLTLSYLTGLFLHIHSTSVIGFDLSVAALAWIGAAILLSLTGPVRDDVSLAFHHIGTATVWAALLFAFFGDGRDQAFFHTLLVAGAVFLGNSWRTRGEGWQHLGVAAWLWAYFTQLSHHAYLDIGNSDLYFAPVGLYVLLLGFLARRRGRQSAAPTYYLIGLILVMAPTLLAIRHSGMPALRASLLATECVAAIFYGLTARIKAFVGAGTVFLIALIAVEAEGSAPTVAWPIYATVLGLAIIVSALFIERRRADLSRWTQTVREKMRDWE